jgi:hypothetical protein
MTGRSVPEWIGKTADTPIPDRVKLRVFEKHKGMCHIAGRKIQAGEPWDAEHVIALCNWLPSDDAPHGNRESNLAPALRSKHPEKTAADVAEKSMIHRKRSKHLGVAKAKRGFPKPPPGYNAWTRRIET